MLSEKYGGLLGLSSIYDGSPLRAALIMLFVDFGAICALMWLEGIPPWKRKHYKTFLWNDTIWIPLYCGLVVVVLHDAEPLRGWYTQSWWHWLLLVGGVGASLNLERDALKSGQYTWSQELSPSKLWHTAIYGVIAYWLTSTIIPVSIVIVYGDRWAEGAALLVIVGGFVYNTIRDATLPWPADAHIEWGWQTLRGQRRKYPPELRARIR